MDEKLVPDIRPSIGQKFGEINYYVTQMLSCHGYFRIYLYRMGKTASLKKVKKLMMQAHCFQICILEEITLCTDVNNWNDHGR